MGLVHLRMERRRLWRTGAPDRGLHPSASLASVFVYLILALYDITTRTAHPLRKVHSLFATWGNAVQLLLNQRNTKWKGYVKAMMRFHW
jgi:hypothetical protein